MATLLVLSLLVPISATELTSTRRSTRTPQPSLASGSLSWLTFGEDISLQTIIRVAAESVNEGSFRIKIIGNISGVATGWGEGGLGVTTPSLSLK